MLITHQGFDLSTTIAHYTLGIGWDESLTTGGSVSTTASRNASGNGLALVSSGWYMTWVVQPSEEDDLFITGVAYKPTAFYTLSTGFNSILVLKSDSGTTQHITVGHDNTGKIQVKLGSTGGTIIGQEAGNTFSLLNVYHYIEVKCRLHDTTGSVEVRVDGNTTPVINESNVDTKNGGTKTVFDAVALRDGLSAATGGGGHFDDFYLCNEQGSVNNDFLGDIVVQAVTPNGNGTSSQLTGSDGNSTDNYLLIDESPPNTTDYVGSATDDLQDTYAFTNISGTPTSIRGVALYAFAAKSDAGPKSVALVTRSGGTEVQTADKPLSMSWAYYRQLYETDPTDTTAWTQTKVDNAEFGVKVRP